MNVSTMFMSKEMITQPLINLPPRRINTNPFFNLPKLGKEKVVIVIGATGTGKSRLSIDIATRFSMEVINSDKMQVYDGLDIVTNKVTKREQRGVPHHLLGVIDPFCDFSAADFSDMAMLSLDSICSRGRLPIIAGGSNSFIETLVDSNFQSRYECCFLWVDVSIPVLQSFVSDRVDKMVAKGMVDEAEKFFDPARDYSRGIKRAIGVPEFDSYFRCKSFLDEKTREKLLQESISKVKEHTCKLALRQLGKIQRLRNIKEWNIHRLDATEVFTKRGKEAEEAWNKLVTARSTTIIDQFLHPKIVTVKTQKNLESLPVPSVPPKKSAAIAAATP
ncbi:adenylate isopentenyltransferase 3, chloroplastic-like [Cucurbita moschata]|uniref:adenylate dimethylallyltransferase (ADP/ATP-dependent) n=1 Tax=Cucurbita moschata TaxID=3662 RepID=A0A6J1GR83_CUCMO|nr:adenylate isopentenyltransferase 3, chloroplastic-like [Cucurbita moschata]